ncbi:TRAP transporter large permease [Halalkalibacter krulwichiae]|uniref:Sialic acid TRAP transporter permease protein SiaT n=1 Tax=Halalkalibacter krulwichiae TaxID=199441 RepID=A0A1X9MFW7_9BACI|nr:TRAP transporter large permease [Halalkalibacter krulwichiae]ARK32306.1 Sialic acid TRAP transporter permease protein SiaT [Halalkalibacter krulwichiae]
MITILLLAALLLMAMGLPIAVTIGLVSIGYIFINEIPVNIITQQIVGGVDVTSLLAIPLFILAGDLMSKGGLAKRMIRLASALVGKVSGGLGLVTVLACMFFSAISGSGVATAAALGSLMIPAMVNKGYDRGFASSIVATASPLGVIIPPSISFIIYSSLTGVSVANLYKVGIPAGLLIGFVLMILFYFLARKHGYKAENTPFDRKEFWSALKDSLWALGTPVILVGGVFGGVFTPTESAVAAVFYALGVGLFIYKDLKFKDILPIFYGSAKLTANIMFIIANASLLAWVLTAEGIPQSIVATFLSFSDNPIVILLIINLIILIIGLFMETSATLVILVPLFLPIVTSLGMDPLHFGIVVVIGTAIGLATPPFGVCLFTAASVGKVSIQKLSKHIVLPILVMIAVLLFITFVPEVVMFLVK